MFKSDDVIEMVENAERNIPFICDAYNLKVTNLLENLKKTFEIDKIRVLFNDFIVNYTMIKELWILWFRFECYNGEKSEEKFIHEELIRSIGDLHFVLDGIFITENQVYQLMTDKKIFFSKFDALKLSQYTVERFHKILTYPISYFKRLIKPADKLSTYPLDVSITDTYEKAQNLPSDFWDIHFCYEKYISILKITYDNNISFIADVIEFRLSSVPSIVQLWKVYINYLSEASDIRVLKVYSRYCRLFINDYQMIENYQKEIERMQKLLSPEAVYESWIDLLELKRVFYGEENLNDIIKNLVKKIKASEFKSFIAHFENQGNENYARFKPVIVCFSAALISKKILFNYNTAQRQNFTLPSPLILYILDNSSVKLRQKLQKMCKYFYYKSKKPICHRLRVYPDSDQIKSTFQKQALNITVPSFNLRNLNGYIITNILFIHKDVNNRNIASSLLSQKIQVNVKYMDLTDQDLTLDELNLLKSDNLEELSVNNVIITDFEETSIEKIMQIFSYVDYLSFDGYTIFSDTSKNLANLKGCKRFKRKLIFKNVNDNFDPLYFSRFLINVCQKHSFSTVEFSQNVSADVKENFKIDSKEYLYMSCISVYVE